MLSVHDQRALGSQLLRIVGQRLAYVILDASESSERANRLSRLPTQISSWIKSQVLLKNNCLLYSVVSCVLYSTKNSAFFETRAYVTKMSKFPENPAIVKVLGGESFGKFREQSQIEQKFDLARLSFFSIL